MKKNIFIILATVAVGLCAGTAYSRSGNVDPLSPLEMENLEALANDESSDPKVQCFCRTDVSGICSAMGTGAYCGGDPCNHHDANCR